MGNEIRTYFTKEISNTLHFWFSEVLDNFCIDYLRSKNLVTDRHFKVSLKSYQTPSYLLSYEKLVILTFKNIYTLNLIIK